MSEIAVRDAGEFLAALPHLVGYVPTESLVVVGLRLTPPEGDLSADFTLREDLPLPAAAVEAGLRPYTAPLVGQGYRVVMIAVISEGPPPPDGALPPYAGLVADLLGAYYAAGVRVHDCVWAPRLEKGAPWRRYGHPGEGEVADPFDSEISAALAAVGQLTLPDRATLVARLKPAQDVVLRRRQQMIEQRLAQPTRPATHESVQLLNSWVRRFTDAWPALNDHDVVALCVALDNPFAREEALRFTLDERGPAAHNLWCALLTESPAPHTAEVAVLLAWCELLHGRGSLLMVALGHALDTCPGHKIALLLMAGVIDGHLHPGTAREALLYILAPDEPGRR